MSKNKKILIFSVVAIILTIVAIIIIILTGKRETYRFIEVDQYNGSVTLERNGTKPELFEGLHLITDDMVSTGDASDILLLADTDKHILVEENTGFSVEAEGNETKGRIAVNLMYGSSLITIDNKLPDGSEFVVNTPNAALSVRGTVFHVFYDPETETTTVEVTEGVVEVVSADGTQNIEAGGMCTVSGGNYNAEEIVTENITKKKILKSVKETYYNDDGSIKSYRVDKYNSKGKIINWTSYNVNGNVDIYRINEYDSKGNMVKNTVYDVDGNICSYSIYEYDSDGKAIKSTEYNADGAITHYFIYEYDSYGKEIKYTLFNADSTINHYRISEYNSDGVQIKQTEYNAEGNINATYENVYDSEGYQIKYIVYNADETVDYYYTNKSEFDSDGNLIKSTSYNADGTIHSEAILSYSSPEETVPETTVAKTTTPLPTATSSATTTATTTVNEFEDPIAAGRFNLKTDETESGLRYHVYVPSGYTFHENILKNYIRKMEDDELTSITLSKEGAEVGIGIESRLYLSTDYYRELMENGFCEYDPPSNGPDTYIIRDEIIDTYECRINDTDTADVYIQKMYITGDTVAYSAFVDLITGSEIEGELHPHLSSLPEEYLDGLLDDEYRDINSLVRAIFPPA